MRRGVSHCRYLQHAFAKYGKDAFVFEVLEELEPEFLIGAEQWWINMLAPEYNSNPVAGNCAGRRMRAESRQKIRESLMGHPVSEEALEKMRAHRWSDEDKLRIGAKSRGHITSPETRAKMSAAHDGKDHMPPEARKRMAAARRGTHPTPETIEKLRLSHLGNKSHLGFRHSPEVRDKISKAVRDALTRKERQDG
jgi:group I intron endonuclease